MEGTYLMLAVTARAREFVPTRDPEQLKQEWKKRAPRMLQAAGELVTKSARSRAYAEKLRTGCAIFDSCSDSVLQHISMVGTGEITTDRVQKASVALKEAASSSDPSVEHRPGAPWFADRNQAAARRRQERVALDQEAVRLLDLNSKLLPGEYFCRGCQRPHTRRMGSAVTCDGMCRGTFCSECIVGKQQEGHPAPVLDERGEHDGWRCPACYAAATDQVEMVIEHSEEGRQ